MNGTMLRWLCTLCSENRANKFACGCGFYPEELLRLCFCSKSVNHTIVSTRVWSIGDLPHLVA